MSERGKGDQLTREEAKLLRECFNEKTSKREAAEIVGVRYRTVEHWYEVFSVGDFHPKEERPEKKLPARHYVGSFELE